MNLYLWKAPELTEADGDDAFLVIAADTLEEAKNLLQPFIDAESAMTMNDEDANESLLKLLNKDVVVGSYLIEPPGDWEILWHHQINWDYLLATPPTVIPLDRPRIVAYYYGYTG